MIGFPGTRLAAQLDTNRRACVYKLSESVDTEAIAIQLSFP